MVVARPRGPIGHAGRPWTVGASPNCLPAEPALPLAKHGRRVAHLPSLLELLLLAARGSICSSRMPCSASDRGSARPGHYAEHISRRLPSELLTICCLTIKVIITWPMSLSRRCGFCRLASLRQVEQAGSGVGGVAPSRSSPAQSRRCGARRLLLEIGTRVGLGLVPRKATSVTFPAASATVATQERRGAKEGGGRAKQNPSRPWWRDAV